ncbi:enoyl-CoA hydratase-related protein [Nocardia carnea]|uniref:enoyl-CoA hydratase-related protein n=1 Tax=Nocardia carnea TaxID=37328 RepID=UPI002455AE56|nr:enoyl-CoA hydratase-related protein [Nocardia carnea]
MTGRDAVVVERRGRVQIITMTRAAKRNAIDPSITAGLDAAFNEFEDDPDLWCAVLTGGAEFFCAGADLATGPGEPTPRGGIAGLIQRRRTKPLIAAVEGFALGGGFELVLSCDLVVASRTARFGLPEPKRGLVPDFGGAFRAARLLPANIAREMLLTARDLPAQRAERLGLVNELTEPGGALDAAVALAEEICGNAPLAVREALAIVNQEIHGDETAAWARSNAAHQRLLTSRDVSDGVGAFFEKRPPRWTGE